ncbi:MAG: hypothetical protein ACE5F1_13670 [Planctomycetota bacterium]
MHATVAVTLLGASLGLSFLSLPQDQAREPIQKGLKGAELRRALKDTAADFWIYDDLDAGYARGRKTGKPLLVSFRCVP